MTTTLRDLRAVIGTLLEMIPSDEQVLREKLERVRKPLDCRAPEAMWREWIKVGEILQDQIPLAVRWSPWQFLVVAVFLNLTPEEVLRQFPEECGTATSDRR